MLIERGDGGPPFCVDIRHSCVVFGVVLEPLTNWLSMVVSIMSFFSLPVRGKKIYRELSLSLCGGLIFDIASYLWNQIKFNGLYT